MMNRGWLPSFDAKTSQPSSHRLKVAGFGVECLAAPQTCHRLILLLPKAPEHPTHWYPQHGPREGPGAGGQKGPWLGSGMASAASAAPLCRAVLCCPDFQTIWLVFPGFKAQACLYLRKSVGSLLAHGHLQTAKKSIELIKRIQKWFGAKMCWLLTPWSWATEMGAS